MDSFSLLGFGNFTSLITKIEIISWGKKVIINCVYDPDDRLPYQFIFHDCREIKWNLIFPEEVDQLEADIIDFILGREAYEHPALFHTDIFQLTILYGHLELQKHW